MSPLARPALRLADAATASGLSKKDIRNWLDRGILSLLSEQQQGWVDFSYADVAMLALVAEMTRASIPAAPACRIARKVIEDTGLTTNRAAPPLALPGVFTLKALVIWPHDGELLHQLIAESELAEKPHRTRPALFVLRPAGIIINAMLAVEESIED